MTIEKCMIFDCHLDYRYFFSLTTKVSNICWAIDQILGRLTVMQTVVVLLYVLDFLKSYSSV